MTQRTFSRGLKQEFLEALNELYDQPDGWWRRLVDDKELFLAIRENYVNVYHLGGSLLKLKPEGQGVVGEVHYKYLLRPRLTTSEYVKVIDGVPSLPAACKMFTQNLAEVREIKKATRPHASAEKSGVHDVVLSNWNIVDVEIAFATDSGDESEGFARRVDFAALQKGDRCVEIVFFEAKDFTNSELRAKGVADPKVFGQIEKYGGQLRERHDEVVASYRRVCENLLDLRGLDERHPRRHELLKGIVDGSTPFKVNVEPRLVVFGFDADQRDGKHWKPHRDKLVDRLGDRVLFRGNAKGFTRGVST